MCCQRNNLDRSSALHLQLSFPFNLTPARRPPIEDVAKEVEVEKKQRRRFSMSDVLNLNSFSNARSSFSQSRFFDLGKSSRSRSQSRSPTRAPSISSETRRRRFRNPFNMASSKRNEKIESVLATPIPQGQAHQQDLSYTSAAEQPGTTSRRT